MKKVIYYYFVALSLFFGACIGIEDKIAPLNESAIYAQNNAPKTVYRIGDVLIVPIFIRDNSRLDTIKVSVRRKEGSLFNTFKIDYTKKALGGRAYIDTIRQYIPPSAETGDYVVEIVAYDFSKNKSNIVNYDINIQEDADRPVITSFKASVNNTPLKEDGTSVICRLDVIKIEGAARDNIGIKEVRATLTGMGVTATDLPYGLDQRPKEVDFATIIGTALKVPASAQNGSTLTLELIVLDVAGNRDIRQIKFKVDCDDQAPLIEITRTNPVITLLGTSREVRVVEGASFQVLDGKITDERGLKRLTVTMGLLNIPNPEVLLNKKDFASDQSVTFQTVVRGTRAEKINFLTASAGQTYELLMVTEDVSGNTSVPYRILISILKDELPNILITDFYLDNIATRVTSGENPIRSGQTLRIEGKIIEDFRLQELKIYWGEKDAPRNLVNLTSDKLTNLPFDFSSVGSINTFTVPSEATAGTIYELKIEVKDNKNPTERRRYFFKVQ